MIIYRFSNETWMGDSRWLWEEMPNISKLSLFLFVSKCNRPYMYHVCYNCNCLKEYDLCICAELVMLWALHVDCYTQIAPVIQFYVLFHTFHTLIQRLSKAPTGQDKLWLTRSHGSFGNINIIIINNSTNNHYYNYH